MVKLNEVLDAIRARVSHPLLISFVVAWLVANYRFVIVLLSPEPYERKFKYIEAVLYNPDSDPLNRLLWIPLTGALTYVLIVPFISLGTTLVNGWFENLNKRVQLFTQARTPISVQDRAELLKRIAEREARAITDAENARTERHHVTSRTIGALRQLLFELNPFILAHIAAQADRWPDRVLAAGEYINGNDSQDHHIQTVGISTEWAALFDSKKALWSDPMTPAKVARALTIPEKDALMVLFYLHALHLVEIHWLEGDLAFQITDIPWAQKLRGLRA